MSDPKPAQVAELVAGPGSRTPVSPGYEPGMEAVSPACSDNRTKPELSADDVYEEGRQDERALIVDWLVRHQLSGVAAALERGAHLETATNG